MTAKPQVAALLPVLLGILFAASACSSTPGATEWTFGDALATRVKETRFVEQVAYSLDDKHYLLKPSQEDRALLAAFIEVRNREANVTYLTIHKNNIRLRDENSFDYQPLDPFKDRIEADEGSQDENAILPFIWADGSDIAPTIDLPAKCGLNDENCQLVGWVFFEVPRSIKPSELIWDAGDTIYMRF